MSISDAPQRVADAVERPFEGHADRYRPLGGYAALVGAFNLSTAAFVVAAERRGRLPERYPLGDLALLSAGTFKLSLDQWVAGAYLAGYAIAPRPTRAVAALFTIYGAADVLQLGYSRLQQSDA